MEELVAVVITPIFGEHDEGVPEFYGVIKDTPEARREVLEDGGFLGMETFGEVDEVIAGKVNVVYFENTYRDWDDPIGYDVGFRSKGSLLAEAQNEYQQTVKQVNKMFEKGSN